MEFSKYNGLNQLVETNMDEITVEYAYRPGGLRLSKTVDGVETSFVLDGGSVVLEYVDGSLSGKYMRGINMIASVIGSNTSYYLYNAHGDVVQLTNSAGAVTKTYDYDAFGNERDPDAEDTNPFRYCGEYYDKETGTYYLRARYYDPRTGRVTQQDPARAGLNWYTYCGNNPIAFIDPWGLVEVGLRAYAATYEGSVVEWNEKTNTATVTWNGIILSVTSTDQNTRDGCIYVDDSLFVSAFGIGNEKLIVYQDAVTNNVSIRANFNITGNAADSYYAGSPGKRAPTYGELFRQGNENYWSGTFGEYNVSTYTGESLNGINVKIKHVNLDKKIFQDNSHTGQFFGWSKTNLGSITMYTGDGRNNTFYSFDQFMWVSAHEFGHILGVGDMYTNPNYAGVSSIFNGYVGEFGVQGRDIAKVLTAWSTGKWQTWN